MSTPTIEGLFGAPEESEEDRVVAAAKALREAVVNHKGRRKSLVAWKPVVAKVLRVTKLYTKRYKAVLDKGEELGLFRVDDTTLSYAIIVPLDPVETPEEPEDLEDFDEPVAKPRPPAHPPVSKVSAKPPKDWKPMQYLPCGHWEHQQIPRPRAEGEDPREGTSSISVHVTDVAECPSCKAGKPGHPQHQEEGYRTPVQPSARRTIDKEAGLGFPGYCCDEDGYYIGGTFNHCRHANPKGPWCEVHGGGKAKPAPKPKRKRKRRRKTPAKTKGILADAEKGTGLMDASAALADGIREER